MGNELVDGLNKFNEALQVETNTHTQTAESYKCDQCGYLNQTYDTTHRCHSCNTTNVRLQSQVNYYKTQVTIWIPYILSVTIKDIIDKVVTALQNKRAPLMFIATATKGTSFCGKRNQRNDFATSWHYDKIWKEESLNSVTDYSINDIVTKGIYVELKNMVELKVTNNRITCSDMVNDEKKDAENPLKCNIYKQMLHNKIFTEVGLLHLNQFCHFVDEYKSKPKCKHGQQCKSFLRLEKGGNELNDRCHVKLYNHPPRRRHQVQMSDNVKTFMVATENKECAKLMMVEENEKSYKDKKIREQYNFNHKDGWILALIEEVTANGFQYDLCLQCDATAKCNHSDYSILHVVDQKLKHIRHKQMGSPLRRDHMLALVLYTGCDCNYAMCAAQRNGNYNKWKWFDYCLRHAIQILNRYERGNYKVYTGLNEVQLDKKHLSLGYFPTYTSTSWVRDVSQQFMGDKGMIIEIDEKYRSKKFCVCCDVSWISKFPDECEILFARSIHLDLDGYGCFKLSVLDQQSEIQTVLLENADRETVNAKNKQRGRGRPT
eukprot:439709_1